MVKLAAKKGAAIAFLTAVVVFCSALLTAIDQGKISWLILVSAVLMAVIAFCQKLLEVKYGRNPNS
jgi:uncharacterized membrane protein